MYVTLFSEVWFPFTRIKGVILEKTNFLHSQQLKYLQSQKLYMKQNAQCGISASGVEKEIKLESAETVLNGKIFDDFILKNSNWGALVNNCCHGKAISITYCCVCVCVWTRVGTCLCVRVHCVLACACSGVWARITLLIQHATLLHYVYCHLWRLWFHCIFRYFSVKGTIFGKKFIEHEICIWFSLKMLSETFLILGRI